MTKVFELLIYYSYIFVFIKIFEREFIKYYRINNSKYKNVDGIITNVRNESTIIDGEYQDSIIYTVSYNVNGKEYSFKFNKLWYQKKRNVGETIYLKYDIDNPSNHHIIGDHRIIIFFLPFALYILYRFINYLIKSVIL